MYDQREKAQRDYEAFLASAREEGREEGIEKGREEGLELGILAGQVRLLQESIGEQPTPVEELLALPPGELNARLMQCQSRLRTRNG